MRHRLTEVWPSSWLSLVQRIGQLAGDRPIYLVGGAVRDLLLGQPNLDVDLVVDGDALPLAREVVQAFPGAELNIHEKFGTAQVKLADGRKVDFATARTEFYEHPAALPTVDYSSIKQDLARRDFSVNAMALRLNASHFGDLLDFFTSRSDIERKSLKVLHNLSFIEDPTRLFRAVRFEQQLGFTLDDQSASFALYAMATGRFDGIGGERNKVELRRILSLSNPLPAAKRLGELDGWRVLHPALTPGPEAWRRFVRARRLFRLFATDEAHRWLTYLTIILSPLPLDAVHEVLRRLNLTNEDKEYVTGGLELAASLAEAQPLESWTPAELYHRFEELSAPVLVYLGVAVARTGDRRALIRYWQQLKPVRLTVNGGDLRALGLPPGPRYAQILKSILDARLNGELTSPEEERAMLERLARTSIEESQ
jgi:tRNA nucleotidyltransferase (CCA-adding enzyme)